VSYSHCGVGRGDSKHCEVKPGTRLTSIYTHRYWRSSPAEAGAPRICSSGATADSRALAAGALWVQLCNLFPPPPSFQAPEREELRENMEMWT
jgi:hypothetical protein